MADKFDAQAKLLLATRGMIGGTDEQWLAAIMRDVAVETIEDICMRIEAGEGPEDCLVTGGQGDHFTEWLRSLRTTSEKTKP